MRVGISSLLFNINEALNICSNIKKINHIEIGIDNLYECDKLLEYKNRINDLGLSVSIHLPMELNSCENIEYIRNSWVDFIININDRLSEFNIKYFNLHLGYVMTNRLNKNREKYLENSILFFNELSKKIDTKISIENTYSKNGDFTNVGNIKHDFEYIFSKHKNDNLWFCYDTGHYLIDSDEYLNTLKEKINVIHLSDNDGVEDIHIGIGRGILPEKHIKELLNIECEYLILEINYEDIQESINKLNDIIKEV